MNLLKRVKNAIINEVTITISKDSYEEILYDLSELIGMKEIEGFECDSVYGLLKYLMAISKKQLGVSYKFKHGQLIKLN